MVKYSIFPRDIQISLADVCNYKCISCWLYSPNLKAASHNCDIELFQSSTPVLMDFELYKKFIDSLPENKKIFELDYCGKGEPTIHPNFFDMLHYANSKSIITNLTTNGSRLTFDFLKEINTTGLKNLTVSLNASNLAEHKQFSNLNKNIFTKIVNAIHDFNHIYTNKQNFNLNLSFVVSGYNIDNLKNMIILSSEILKKGGTVSFHLKVSMPHD